MNLLLSLNSRRACVFFFLILFNWLFDVFDNSNQVLQSDRILKSWNRLKLFTLEPPVPDVLHLFELGEGPWISNKVPAKEWKKFIECNPYSGRCSCLRDWGIHLNECIENATTNMPVLLEASGWMTDWPYLSGLHRCKRSICDVRHGHTRDSRIHARLFSVTDASVEKANANGAVMVVVAMESRSRFPLHGTLEFKYFFDLGVSYHDQLDIQVSYNNYLPKDFSSTGVPFNQKRNSLLFMYTNCGSLHRNELFDRISQLISIDALGPCKNNGDAATTLPQCAALPRSGDTIWSEKECLLYHYKFYLAIENSRDKDYVTEKLYQGLRAGSVPIYLGAPNIHDFLPHPDSVLLIEDFHSIEALVDYVKLASNDEKLYAKHMVWKTKNLSDTFMNRVATKPMDSIFCKVCDFIATKYGDGVGPSIGGKGDALNLPWCIVQSLNARPESVIKNWHKHENFMKSKNELRTYVLSVKGALKRQLFMHKQLTIAQLQADLVTGFDPSDVDIDMISCWRPHSTLDDRSHRDMIGPKLLSLVMKYVFALWNMWQEGVSVALILEDDAELKLTFSDDISAILREAPLDWDFIMVGTCSNIHATDDSLRVSQHLFLPTYPDRPTRCAHAILWSYSGAKKLLASMPIRWELDWHINSAAFEGNWTSYWAEPALSEQVQNYTSMLQTEREELSFLGFV